MNFAVVQGYNETMNSDKSVIDILEELEETAGSLAKREILDTHVKNDLLKRAFVAAGDPYIVYYVNKFKAPAPKKQRNSSSADAVLQAFLNTLNLFSRRELTGNAAKERIASDFADMTELEQKWCQRILLKNMRCGVQTTVNKVWPGAIKTFEVSLAETLKSEFVKGKGIKLLEPVKYPVRVEPKLDGLRCIAIKQKGQVTFFTRNGTLIETLHKIGETLTNTAYDNVVLDAEVMGESWNDSASIMMSKKTHKDDSSLVLNVFDALPFDEWTSQKTDTPYSERVSVVSMITEAIMELAEEKGEKNICVVQVPHIMAQNETELLSYFQKCMNEEFEGVMLKTLDTPYKFKRSKNILKLKPCVTYEGIIVGHYEGRRGTRREGLFGGFEAVLPNGVITRLGGGFSDALKADIQLEGPESYLGKVVEIEAQPDPCTPDGLSKDGKARFPVFVRFRDEADVSQYVIDAGVTWFEAQASDV